MNRAPVRRLGAMQVPRVRIRRDGSVSEISAEELVPGDLVMLEQPELHLHPAAQLGLADFLLACVRSGRQIIVESHSEHLVNRLRRRVAEADDDPELHQLIGIVFAERDRAVTRYRSVDLNPLGGFDSWPSSFFPEGADEVRHLLEAGLQKRARILEPD